MLRFILLEDSLWLLWGEWSVASMRGSGIPARRQSQETNLETRINWVLLVGQAVKRGHSAQDNQVKVLKAILCGPLTLQTCLWPLHSYKVCRVVKNSTKKPNADSNLIPNWGLRSFGQVKLALRLLTIKRTIFFSTSKDHCKEQKTEMWSGKHTCM